MFHVINVIVGTIAIKRDGVDTKTAKYLENGQINKVYGFMNLAKTRQSIVLALSLLSVKIWELCMSS